jgi:hypothetical protein
MALAANRASERNSRSSWPLARDPRNAPASRSPADEPGRRRGGSRRSAGRRARRRFCGESTWRLHMLVCTKSRDSAKTIQAKSMTYATLPPTVKDGLGAQFLLDAHCAVAGIDERMVEHGLLDLSRHPERSLGPGAGGRSALRRGSIFNGLVTSAPQPLASSWVNMSLTVYTRESRCWKMGS